MIPYSWRAKPWSSLLRSLLVGVAGGALLGAIGLPLAWLVGPIIGNLLLLTRGVSVWLPTPLRAFGLGMMGLVMGSLVTPELMGRLAQWHMSLLVLIVSIIVSTLVVARWYRYCGFDVKSAWLSAIPGGMAAMVTVVEQTGGNLQRVAVSQALRVLIVVCVLPPFFVLFNSSDTTAALVVAQQNGFSNLWMVLMIPVLVVLGMRLSIGGAPLLLPLLFSATLSATGLAQFEIPIWGMNLALLFLGCSIAAKFGAFPMREVLANAKATFVATILALGVFSVFAELIHQLTDVPRAIALLALVPGGMAEMAILALALGLDPLFVAFHQLFRVIGLVALTPILARCLREREQHTP